MYSFYNYRCARQNYLKPIKRVCIDHVAVTDLKIFEEFDGKKNIEMFGLN